MMTKSEHINELAAALAKAQADIRTAAKDKANPFFKSKYADLASVWEACRGPLTKNGLSVVQLPRFAEGLVSVETCLLHASGQWISTELSSPVKDLTAQSIGSATTYLRRYSLASIAGVAPDEDDDGNEASQRGKNGHKHEPEPRVDDATMQELAQAIEAGRDAAALDALAGRLKGLGLSDAQRASLGKQFLARKAALTNGRKPGEPEKDIAF